MVDVVVTGPPAGNKVGAAPATVDGEARTANRFNTLFSRAARRWGTQADVFLAHCYSREAARMANTDPYGEVVATDFDPLVAGLPCLLQQNQIVGVDETGNPTTVTEITLFVPSGDAIKRGDRISNVIDPRSGEMQETGPARVRYVRNAQAWGPVLYSQVYLERIEGQA